MKSFSFILVLTALVTAGCSRKPADEAPSLGVTEVAHVVVLCGHCGQVKESDLCCIEGAELCEKCGLQAGAPGCCNIEKGADVTLCASCGQIKGTELCCAEGATVCADCGWHKGSPACCKIDKPAADGSASKSMEGSGTSSDDHEDAGDDHAEDAPATDAL